MSPLDVRLLGRPTVFVAGVPAPPPKGAKPWGLLAYLASTGRAHTRTELAELLFCEAADPLGALRWNLAALRRLLDRPDALKGDAIHLDLTDARIDTHELDRGELTLFDGDVPGLLLSGLSFGDSPRFELWLAGERARIERQTTSLLRETALRAVAVGDHDTAIAHAGRLVSIDPLDEGHQALLIRAHALAGDAPAARAQFDRCRAVLRAELDLEPGPAVIAASHYASVVAATSRTVDIATVEAWMTVAWQSFLAGSVDHGIDLGRSAVAMADQHDDIGLRITARLFFAAMLSIAVRAWDESATVTTEVIHLAEGSPSGFEAATARGILAGIELMRADYGAATRHATAGAALTTDPGARALNLTFLGAVAADAGNAATAVGLAVDAVAVAEGSGDPIRILYAEAYAGHALLLADDPGAARPHVERAVAVAAPMLALLPWPLAMLSEIETRAGHLDVASHIAGQAAAMSATTDIAYQRGLALRAYALVDIARHDTEQAVDRLTKALSFARRTTGEGYTFHWPVAWILDTLATTTVATEPKASRRWSHTLLDHATAHGMTAFATRATALLDPR
jgi:DNA-binding SARP family transcriptional activator